MWLRFASISALEWIVQNFLSMVMMFYIVPDSWRGYALAAPIWLMTFAVSSAFAYWALHLKRPKWKNIIALAVIWFIVSLLFQAVFEFIVIGRLFFILRSLDMLLTFVIGIASIFIVGAYLRFKNKVEGRIEGVAL